VDGTPWGRMGHGVMLPQSSAALSARLLYAAPSDADLYDVQRLTVLLLGVWRRACVCL
jgi:hypothetical protein